MAQDYRYTQKSRWRRAQRQAVLKRDGYCRMCGHPGDDGKGKGLMQAHLVPHEQGGDDTADNVVLLCGSCHARFDAGRRQRGRA